MKTKKRKYRLYATLKFLFGWLILVLFRVRVRGRENVPKGPLLICANHVGYPDAVVIAAALPRRVRFLAMSNLFRRGSLLKPVVTSLGAIPIAQDTANHGFVKATVAALGEGEAVVIFPQGHRRMRVNPKDTEVRPGLGMLAAKSGGVPILPVSVSMKHQKYAFLRRIRVTVGKPLVYPFTQENAQEYRAATEAAFNKVLRVGGFLGEDSQ